MAKLKQFWRVDTTPVEMMLLKIQRDIRGEVGERAVLAGAKLAQQKMRPFFKQGGEHHQTGMTQKAFIEDIEVVNLSFADRGIRAFVGYNRYGNGMSGYVSAYFERGTPRKSAEKRVPRYSFMSKIARDKEIQEAMKKSINRYMKRYGG